MGCQNHDYWKAIALVCGVTNEDSGIDWQQVVRKAKKEETLQILYFGLWEKGNTALLDMQLDKGMKEYTCKKAVKSFSQRVDLERVLLAAEERGLKLVCFKGYVLAQTYPEWKTRISNDSDIFVYERDWKNAEELLVELGYEKDLENSKNLVPVYVNKARNHVIELHFSLWEDYEGAQMEKLEAMRLTDEEILIPVQVGNASAWTLNPTNHLIFQMFHIIKHFAVQGIGTKYLFDTAFFVNAYKTSLDREYFWKCMAQLHYSDFCVCWFSLCAQYLNMDDSILCGRELADLEQKKERLLDDLMEFTEKKEFNYKVIALMSPYLEGRESASGGTLSRKLALIFPTPDALQDDFDYAKRHHMLLPFAWVHKWCRFIKNRISGKSSSVSEKLSEADRRIAMMQDMNLFE